MSGKFSPIGIPEPTLRRLPVYHNYLKRLADKSVGFISGTQIADDLNLIPIQIRKDLAFTGVVGKPKVGYEVGELMHKIEDSLGWNNSTDAALAGVGHLGSALLGYSGFQACGLNIVTAFDANPGKIGTTIHGKKIFAIDKLPNLVRRLNVRIGILTVPEDVCQSVADLMVNSGIRAIWSFSPARLSVPKHVIVQHENLAASLAVLSKHLEQTLHAQPLAEQAADQLNNRK